MRIESVEAYTNKKNVTPICHVRNKLLLVIYLTNTIPFMYDDYA